MRKLLVLAGICACALHAQDFIAERPSLPGRDLWRVSLTTLALANAVDVHSSWGKHELNSTLAGDGGTFGRQGALIKLGFQGGLFAVEYLITRHRPSGKLYRALSAINFGASAGVSAVAVYNYSNRRPLR